MFDKVLIANRGEIACRVVRTCKRMGVKTVAVYSEADAQSMHVSMADEAILIGPPPAKESYLKGDHIVEVAKRTGAQAIHPGYGFLSENARFSDLVEKSGLVFIGPPASAISAMGSKSESKKIMSKASVPIIPGYHGENQDVDYLIAEAEKIKFPVLIKAVMGGGGKGMRIVERKEDFVDALLSAKRESMSSFGDDNVLVEKYITKPRHIEFQVFADKHGNVVHLFERDCSVQRRHQKIIEEAPAPGMTEELRAQMGTAAVNAAKAVGYVGAGTVEFIMDSTTKGFYFMEMNTRLQVEHPITEMITSSDLVEWQLKVAAGQRLPLTQDQLTIKGHAFEARIYAESPRKGFLPGTGKLVHLSTPQPSEQVRIETGVRQGDQVSIFYDPMIAKLVVWDTDRLSALRRLKLSLDRYRVVGLGTNIEFLGKLATHPSFAAGDVETGFIQRHYDELFPPVSAPSDKVLALGALSVISEERASNLKEAERNSADPHGVWALPGWRLNEEQSRVLRFVAQTSEDDQPSEFAVETTYLPGNAFRMKFKKLLPHPSASQEKGKKGQQRQEEQLGELMVKGTVGPDGEVRASVGDQTINGACVVRNKNTLNVFLDGAHYEFNLAMPNFVSATSASGKGGLTSPMPGKIVKLFVKSGEEVKKGQPLIVMEAMKMEHTIRSPADGKVKSIPVSIDQFVEQNVTLVHVE
jgi:3-methylcrotonyl-CoA carboxylase alpha subunit